MLDIKGKNMTKYLFTLIIIFLTIISVALSKNNHDWEYSSVRIELKDDNVLDRLYQLGLNIEDAEIKHGSHIKLIVNPYEMITLDDNGIEYKILILDLEKHLAGKTPKKYKKKYDFLSSENFTLGSIGGFYTIEETATEFQRMKEKFPLYFADEIVIGKSYEQRDITAYCIGNRDKPEVLLTGMHHAREPIGTTAIVYFLWRLMELADSGNLEAEYLLNERAIWVIPVINPDGWLYNYSRYPQGGGLWRKNRNAINDSTFGIDLNRNYGPYDYWNAPNNGSSINPTRENYRGAYPFSEPELEAVRDFCLDHEFLLALNFHSHGNYLIYPFHALAKETPDSLLYRALSRELSKNNLFTFGTSIQTVHYQARGTSDDWMYLSDSVKNKIIAITPEIGTINDKHYPKPEIIAESVYKNFDMSFQLVWSAVVNVRPFDLYLDYEIDNACQLVLNLRNIGLESGIVKLNVQAIDPLFQIQTSGFDVLVDNSWWKKEFRFDLTVNKPHDFVENGSVYPFEVLLIHDGVSRRDTFQVKLLCYDELVLFDFRQETDPRDLWDMNDWDLEYYEELNQFVLSDSPQAYYQDLTSNYLQLIEPLVLDKPAELEFTSFWNIEPNDDFAVVQISTDDGSNWECLRTSRMVKGSGRANGRQDTSFFGFHGNFTGWVVQRYDLSEYIGQTIHLRFGLLSDRSSHYDGWFIKNINIKEFGDCQLLSSVEFDNNDEMIISQNMFVDTEEAKLNFPLDFQNKFVNICIYNTRGVELYNKSVFANGFPYTISLLDFSSGVYFLRLSTNERVIVKKLTILR